MTPEPLTLTAVLERARGLFPDSTVATRRADGTWYELQYREVYDRICQLAHALDAIGVGDEARVGTVATNHYRHLEVYFGVPCSGRSIHTVNHRLPDEQFEFVLQDATDVVLFVDPEHLPTVEAHADALDSLEAVVVLDGTIPTTDLDPVYAYESLLEGRPTTYDWPTLDEYQPCGLCHTSGTTGDPKGVEQTHRAITVATQMMLGTDTVGVGEADVVFPIVPMFHGYGWGYPYAALLAGSDLVLGNGHTDPTTIVESIESHHVSIAAAVPTIWIEVAEALEDADVDLSDLDLIQTGGSAVPESLIRTYEADYDVTMVQAWGMTETAPFATLGWPPATEDLDEDERFAYRATAGRPVPGISVRVRDGTETVPRDGETVGELEVTGAWVIDSYFERPEADADGFTDDGWLRTGDLATWNRRGYIDIVDRTKDVIKSGGEWISSIQLQNELMAHPAVSEAAIVAIDHETWQERPVAFVAVDDRADVDAELLETHLSERFPSWWLPDSYEFVDSLPRTGTGKFDKERLADLAN